jgi:hypothetical protein
MSCSQGKLANILLKAAASQGRNAESPYTLLAVIPKEELLASFGVWNWIIWLTLVRVMSVMSLHAGLPTG